MKKRETPEISLQEIIFENRNKAYGAYELRSLEGEMLQKALAITLVGIVSFAAVPYFVKSVSANQLVEVPTALSPMKEIYLPPREKTVPLQKVRIAAPAIKTYDSSVPTPAAHPTKEKERSQPENLDTAVPSTQDQNTGEIHVTTYIRPETAVPVIRETSPPVITEKRTNQIEKTVDVEAQYAGGLDNFRKAVGVNFDPEPFEGRGERLTAVVRFVVEIDGSVSQITVTGKDSDFNEAAKSAVMKVKGKWKAAQLRGETVRSYFQVPITMQFE